MESSGHMLCQWDMTTTAGNGGTAVFTLPAAYRPAQAAVAVSQTNGSTTAAQLNVSTAGVVQLQRVDGREHDAPVQIAFGHRFSVRSGIVDVRQQGVRRDGTGNRSHLQFPQ